ncbi:cell wall-binding repeat-containing protein [Anaerobacillus sp. CMMVII]|uniref:cell wall-binding repeat-containing protein n=1 Tax=Anaerobacillus sp. CMMVII TaxID=2755588 RepID=UPI0021B803B7|nr:cell wall-binding repeat-containing protein [Anaerobacillus sp. CMMVII]MCT8140327.1 cell wall-binding repeat-containing protein [Anaerobacillus sp. CMMVII]
MEQKISSYFVVVILFFASFLVFNQDTLADQVSELTVSETFIFKGEETTNVTVGGLEIFVENSEEHSRVLLNNDLLKEIEFGFVERMTNFTKGEDTYLLFEYRYHGSGSILFFNIVKISEDRGQVIYQSKEFPRGILKVLNTELELAVPNYAADDSLAAPSLVSVTHLEINGENVKAKAPTLMSMQEYEGPKFQLFSTQTYQNPTAAEINRLLTEKALANNIPPELLKAIAWQESRWRQFNSWGEPLIGFDGRGIGILQVTPGVTGIAEIDLNLNDAVERLKTDINYNIDMGIRILLQKWNWTGRILPRINDGSWDVIDHWYFAMIAYNGVSAINDPNFNTNPGYPPFQQHLLGHLSRNGLLNIPGVPKNELDIFYNDTEVRNSSVMRFTNKMQYDLFGPMTKTKHLFKQGDLLRTTMNVNLRTSPGGSIITTVQKGQMVTITGNFEYQNNNNNHYVWYPVRYQDGSVTRTGYVASSFLVNVHERLSGQTRHETAVLISQQGWEKADTVVLARGDDFPDALAGAPLAYMLNAPMLLTRTDRLSPITKREIERLEAKRVVILGGHLAVSQRAEDELREMGLQIERISGPTRFATAQLIADRLGQQHKEVIVINVDAFADAMAIAPYAARNRVPILLTNRTSIPNVTKTVLDQAERTIVIGGDLVIADSLVAKMPNVTKQFNGRNRFETAAQIVRDLHPRKNNAFVVSGNDFPDGLTGAVLAASHLGDSIILTNRDTLPAATRELITEFTNVTVIGGTLAISDGVLLEIRNR